MPKSVLRMLWVHCSCALRGREKVVVGGSNIPPQVLQIEGSTEEKKKERKKRRRKKWWFKGSSAHLAKLLETKLQVEIHDQDSIVLSFYPTCRLLILIFWFSDVVGWRHPRQNLGLVVSLLACTEMNCVRAHISPYLWRQNPRSAAHCPMSFCYCLWIVCTNTNLMDLLSSNLCWCSSDLCWWFPWENNPE